MDPQNVLDQVPRLDLRGFTSPVQRLERFGEAIGAEIWCKRDDLGSIGLAGNKVRKLEVELHHALAQGARHLVAEGSRLSNATRAVAAAAAAIGLRCTLVLRHDEPREPVGNLLLDGLFGAELRFVGERSWAELASDAAEIVAELEEQGEKVYRLPIGCASERSCLGFASAMLEVTGQLRDAGVGGCTIVHASSSGGTHAGLALGNALLGRPHEVLGIVVAEDVYEDVPGTYLGFARGGARILGVEVDLDERDIRIDQSYLGQGYGLPAGGEMEAIDLLARTEGILADPVYSGKALAAVIDLSRRGLVTGPILFWHTGGYHSLFDPRFARRAWNEIDRLAAVTL